MVKIVKGLKFKDGFVSYSSGRMFNPADAIFVNEIRADHTWKNVVEEFDEKGRFTRLSFEVGG